MPVVWGNEADLALGGFGMLEEVMAVPAAEVREGAPEVVAEIGLHGAGGYLNLAASWRSMSVRASTRRVINLRAEPGGRSLGMRSTTL